MTVSWRPVRRRVLPLAGAAFVLLATLVAGPPASAQPSAPPSTPPSAPPSAPGVLPDSVPRQWTSQRPGGAIVAVLADTVNQQVYVAGGTVANARDYAVVAYSEAGRVLWSATYGDGAPDIPTAAALDPVNHQLYVTGYSSIRDQGDFLTVAFGADGQRLWAATWAGPTSPGGSTDIAAAVAVDPGTHRVYVAGGGGSKNGRVVTVAYEADGTQAWVATYTGNAKVGADGFAVAVDPTSHDVVVGGSGATAPSTARTYVVVSYDAAGRLRWVDHVDSVAAGLVFSVAIDPGTHAAYVTGYIGASMVTIGYDADGHPTWTRRYSEPQTTGEVVLVDPGTHQVYVIAQGNAPGTGIREYLTVSYAPDGTVQWRRYYGGSGMTATDSYPLAAALDPVAHAVYLTGASTVPNQDYDIATIGYDQSGARLFAARYGGTGSDTGSGIAVDPGRGIYVAGETTRPHSTVWTTIAY